jgi:hypothetical protein
MVKRILFHFIKNRSKDDEWIEFGSDRIARLDSKVHPPESKGPKKVMAGKRQERAKVNKKANEKGVASGPPTHKLLGDSMKKPRKIAEKKAAKERKSCTPSKPFTSDVGTSDVHGSDTPDRNEPFADSFHRQDDFHHHPTQQWRCHAFAPAAANAYGPIRTSVPLCEYPLTSHLSTCQRSQVNKVYWLTENGSAVLSNTFARPTTVTSDVSQTHGQVSITESERSAALDLLCLSSRASPYVARSTNYTDLGTAASIPPPLGGLPVLYGQPSHTTGFPGVDDEGYAQSHQATCDTTGFPRGENEGYAQSHQSTCERNDQNRFNM